MSHIRLIAPIEFNPIKLANGTLQIQAPPELCLYSIINGEQEVIRSTLNFLSTIANITLVQHGMLHLDFSCTTKITAAASVLIFAEITRVQLATNQSDVITFSMPTSTEQAKQFRSSGLYKAIMPGTNRKLVKLFEDNHSYQSGIDPNKFLASTLLNLHANGFEFTKPEAKLISKGIQEAMLNVIHHAYLFNSDQDGGIGSRWWQLVYCDTERKRVTFIIYDKGASIPETIKPHSVKPLSDADAIEYAYTKGVTRMGSTTRGKGSEDIKDAAKVKDKSTLIVMSGRGMYFIDNGSGNGLKSPLPHNINGTLIEWSIPYE